MPALPPAAELACNDDADELEGQPNLGFGSRALFNGTADEMVYIFVDGFGGGFEGPYTLSCFPVD